MLTTNLTLEQAVNLGRKFRHRDSTVWEGPFHGMYLECERLEGYSVSQLISSDWISMYEEKKVPLTRREVEVLRGWVRNEDFEKALDKVFGK